LSDDLAQYRRPETKTEAGNAAVALIHYLKNQYVATGATVNTKTVKAGPWLERFIALDDNPRAARIMRGGSLYSIETIELYRERYARYIKMRPY
jgi:hypothetical protein